MYIAAIDAPAFLREVTIAAAGAADLTVVWK
jgi:hypothetical protein